MEHKIVQDGITFDDVLLIPRYSEITPDVADTRTQLTRRISLNIPLISAPMDTVTEATLAIALAQEGGIGIVHKNMSPERQALEVQKVKRTENGIITDPVTVAGTDTVQRAQQLMAEHGVSGFPVTEDGTRRTRVIGILTRRDIRFVDHPAETKVADVMTKDKLVTAPSDTTPAKAEAILNRGRVEKLLLIDAEGRLTGLITMRDIDNFTRHAQACRDARGRLRVGAAVGVMQLDRAERLVAAEVDVIVVDTAHGHSLNVMRTVSEIKKRFQIEVIAGNVGTADGARALIDAGADAVKVGIGPGSICTTRIVTGAGMPQITAVVEASRACREAGITCIADGGIKFSGDVAKAIAAGADCVMIGSLFAGTDESPGETIFYGGRTFKSYRGMGSLGAMKQGSKDRYFQEGKDDAKLVPEGIEGQVPYKGRMGDLVTQLLGGLRAGMGLSGGASIPDFQEKATFVEISGSGLRESHAHDVMITKEAPNYRME